MDGPKDGRAGRGDDDDARHGSETNRPCARLFRRPAPSPFARGCAAPGFAPGFPACSCGRAFRRSIGVRSAGSRWFPLLLLIRPAAAAAGDAGVDASSAVSSRSSVLLQWLRYGDPAMYLAWLALAVYMALYFPVFVLLCRAAVHRFRRSASRWRCRRSGWASSSCGPI